MNYNGHYSFTTSSRSGLVSNSEQRDNTRFPHVSKLTDEDLESPDKIIPEEFYEFWDVFKQVAGIK